MHRVLELDGLRGIAILLVLAGHFGQFSLGLAGAFDWFGEAGVLIFFVLSGFLITTLLCIEDEKASHGVSLRGFYVRRALRLFPAVILLIFVVGVLKLLHLVTDENWVGVAASLLYVRNIFGTGHTLGHLWSLSLEEQFYFVWPMLFVSFPRHRIIVATGVVICVIAFRASGIAFAIQSVASGAFYMRPWYRFDSIMVGCIIALVKSRNPQLFAEPPDWFRRLVHPALGFLLLALFMNYGWVRKLRPWSLTLQTLACVQIVCGLLVNASERMGRALRLKPLTVIGQVSYSIYLWQQIFLVTKTPNWGWIRRPYLDLIATLVCAGLSWRYVEQPFLRLKDRFRPVSKATA